MSGDCFLAALAAAEVAWAEGSGALIAHGTPIGCGPENHGVRYWHAWVEAKGPVGWCVIDVSNGHRLAVKRTVYYRAGKIEPATVLRFTEEEARAELRSRQHAGPWVDNYEAIAI